MPSKIITGTSGWIYREWKGEFYPEDLPQSKWLEYYQTFFDVVEINATFYRLFADTTFLKWKNQAKQHFKYIIKAPRVITHRKLLKNCDSYIKKFSKSIALLEDKLALILLQLSPRMPYDLVRLEKAILAFDDPSRVVVEFRDPKWFTDEVRKLLSKLGCVFCSADSPATEPIDWVTSPIAYIRLHGRKQWYNYKYSAAELKEIIKLLNSMSQQNAKEIYVLFNNDCYAYAIQNALSLKKMLSQ